MTDDEQTPTGPGQSEPLRSVHPPVAPAEGSTESGPGESRTAPPFVLPHSTVEAERDARAAVEADLWREVLQPALDLLKYALHMRMYGERAPGGDETWHEFDRRAEAYMRSLPYDGMPGNIPTPEEVFDEREMRGAQPHEQLPNPDHVAPLALRAGDLRQQRDAALARNVVLERDLAVARQQLDAAREEIAEHEAWQNTIADRIPEDYDDDVAQEAIIDRWLDVQAAELERQRARADRNADVARRLADYADELVSYPAQAERVTALRALIDPPAAVVRALDTEVTRLADVARRACDLAHTLTERGLTLDGYREMQRTVAELRAEIDQPATTTPSADQFPPACLAHTPDGPCQLRDGHPVGPGFPGFSGHMATTEQQHTED